MGGAEIWMEFAELVEHTGFREALAEFGEAHSLPWAKARKVQPPELFRRTDLRWSCARLVAWAGAYRHDPELKRRAWDLMLRSKGNPRETHTWALSNPFEPAPALLSAEPWRDLNLGTNNAAMGSLNLIACLALAPDELERVAGK
jgi:hypothetical protein